MRFRSGLLLLACAACAPVASAGDLDPRGIYHNVFSGGFSGTEWFQVVPIGAGANRYRVADIFSGGFNATIDASGNVTLDGGVGSGSFSTVDAWVITPNLGGTVFTFDNVRAPDTTVDFPLRLASPAPANPILSGTWTNQLRALNPRTGAVIGSGTESLTITSTGTTLRITDPGGLFFQGVFETPVTAGYRAISPNPSDPNFASFPGSSSNIGQDMLGRVTVQGVNDMAAVFLLQTRAPLGSQTQSVFRFTMTRTDPLPAGDLDGDRVIDEDDRALLTAQVGLTDSDDAYNIAADLNLDGVVDALDVAAFEDILPPACPGDFNVDGAVDSTDLAVLLASWGTDGADLSGDGNTDSTDLAILLAAWGDCA